MIHPRATPTAALILVAVLTVHAAGQGDGGGPAPGLVAQQAYVKSPAPLNTEQLGSSIAVSGDAMVAGARNAFGLGSGTGLAHVYERDGSAWSFVATLEPAHGDADDDFGGSVAMDGDTIVVGAHQEDSGATGVDGDETDDTATDAGAAYVFVRDGTAWVQQAYLKASNTGAGDRFGRWVSISGDTIVVGAEYEDSDSTGVDGSQANDDALRSGAAYVFVRTGSTWTQQAYLKASNTETLDSFGRSVTVSGDTIVVGAPGEDGQSIGVNGDETDNGAPAAGAAYVFTRAGTAWSQQAYLKASNPDSSDLFGTSAACDGDTVLIGAVGEASTSTGVGADQTDNGRTRAGAAYVFVRDGTTWSQQVYIKASNADVTDGFGQGANFGHSVALSDDTATVGAPQEDSDAIGVNGHQDDNDARNSGAAYVFERIGASWTQTAYLKASNTGGGDQLGHSVAIEGSTVAAGAIFESSNAAGVNGDGSDNSIGGAGAAYVYVLDSTDPWTDLGFALGGAHGDPVLTGSGPLAPLNAMEIVLSNALESTAAFLFVGFSALNVSPFYGGTLVPDPGPPGLLVVAVTDATGGLALGTTWPAGVPSGFEVYLQSWIDDPAAPFGFSASNALRAVTP